ncbi:hypothetical protein CAWG_06023 [Candida albicans WO-1]|uniref:HORMA domain-containing protein n=1 Tax=Candida albicans (strain WO-1) TaxID=294748 RepID=C4YKL7_CANAW|nr:hypothetical protein CAWG_06023 [Candida albicans WO-1]
MKSHSLPLTVENFLLTFKEYFTVWLNQILYYNHVYEQLTFDQFKSFDLIIYKNRNPQLQGYIEQLIVNVINQLIINQKQSQSKQRQKQKKQQETFNGLYGINCLVYHSTNNTVVRQYTINFYEFIINLNETINELKLHDKDEDNSAIINIESLNWDEIYTQYSTILFHHIQQLKIHEKSLIEERQQDLEVDDLFFKITVDVDQSLYINNYGNWVRLKRDGNRDNDSRDNETQCIFEPIGDVNLELLNFNCYNKVFT